MTSPSNHHWKKYSRTKVRNLFFKLYLQLTPCIEVNDGFVSPIWRNLEIVPGLPAIRVQRWKRGILAGVWRVQVEQLSRRAALQSPEHLWDLRPAQLQQRGQTPSPPFAFIADTVTLLVKNQTPPTSLCSSVTATTAKVLENNEEFCWIILSEVWSCFGFCTDLRWCLSLMNKCTFPLVSLPRSMLTNAFERKSGSRWRSRVFAALMRPRNIFTCWWRETRAPDSCSQMPTWG